MSSAIPVNINAEELRQMAVRSHNTISELEAYSTNTAEIGDRLNVERKKFQAAVVAIKLLAQSKDKGGSPQDVKELTDSVKANHKLSRIIEVNKSVKAAEAAGYEFNTVDRNAEELREGAARSNDIISRLELDTTGDAKIRQELISERKAFQAAVAGIRLLAQREVSFGSLPPEKAAELISSVKADDRWRRITELGKAVGEAEAAGFSFRSTSEERRNLR